MAKVALVALFDETCLGVRHISSYLTAAGHDTHLFILKTRPKFCQPCGEPNDGGYYAPPYTWVSGPELRMVVDEIIAYDPMILGISLVSSCLGLAERLTKDIKQRKDIPVITGGIEPGINPTFNITYSDYVCVSEGEDPMLELVTALEAGGDGTGIQGIWTRKGEEITSSTVRPLRQGLDDLPFPDFRKSATTIVDDDTVYRAEYPARSLFDLSMTVVSQRGCPFSCTFCYHDVTRQIVGPAKYLRRNSVEYFIDQIEERMKLQPNAGMVDIEDDLFTVNPRWCKRFAEEYKRRIGLPFCCYTYPKQLDPEVLDALIDAGLMSMVMGIQSGSTRVLNDFYGRRVTHDDVVKTAHMIVDSGMKLVVDLLIGPPEIDTEEDLMETVELLLKMPRPFIIQPTYALILYEGYTLTQKAREMGVALTHIPGTNNYLAADMTSHTFWSALYHLCPLEEFSPDVIRQLARNRELRENPSTLRLLSDGVLDLANLNGDTYLRKDWHIANLEEQLARTEQESRRREAELQAELATLRGSRLVRGALRLRDAFHRAPEGAPNVSPSGSQGNGHARNEAHITDRSTLAVVELNGEIVDAGGKSELKRPRRDINGALAKSGIKTKSDGSTACGLIVGYDFEKKDSE